MIPAGPSFSSHPFWLEHHLSFCVRGPEDALESLLSCENTLRLKRRLSGHSQPLKQRLLLVDDAPDFGNAFSERNQFMFFLHHGLSPDRLHSRNVLPVLLRSGRTQLSPPLSCRLLSRATNQEVLEDEMAFTSNEWRAAASAHNLPVSPHRLCFHANEFVASPTIRAGKSFHRLLRHRRPRSLNWIASYIGDKPDEIVR
jgi:hypothetical protein